MDLTLPQLSKFKILDQPVALPNKCSGCQIDHNDEGRRFFIDTGVDIDFYGVVYLCTECFSEIAQILGFISSEKWEDIVKSSTDSLIEIEQIQAENDSLRSTVELLARHRCSNSTAMSADLANEGEREIVGSDDEVVSSGIIKSPDDDKSTGGGGFSDLRGDAADNAEPAKSSKRRKPEPEDPFSELGL